jgi:predicted esterase
VAAAAAAVVACNDSSRRAPPAPAPPPSFSVGTPVALEVAGDRPLLVSHAPASQRRAVVYLHGKCSSPDKLTEWAPAVAEQGTVVGVPADIDCPEGGQRWTLETGAIQRRIDEALRAVEAARGAPFDPDVVLVGYSQGASRAEALAAAYPERYRRVVLIGGPTQPAPASFSEAQAVITMAGDRDRQDLMQAGAEELKRAGKEARFLTLPGATHGEYGPEGARVMTDALRWVVETGSGKLTAR